MRTASPLVASSLLLASVIMPSTPVAADVEAEVLRRFDAPEAVQGVAVDPAGTAAGRGEGAFYAIANSAIGKYAKSDGRRLAGWRATDELPLRHLNAGVVRDGRLYCAHSNFPQWPETSSVEVFDTRTLRHIDTHSLGIAEGSLTWVDWRDDASGGTSVDGAWWAVFAHYSETVNNNPRALPHQYTSLVKFDAQWRRLAGWVFPAEVLDRFEPHSCSGGGWATNELLSASGHDRGELCLLKLPQCGSTLRHVETVTLPITGQAIAWDRGEEGVVYGIDRRARQVVVSRLPLLHDATMATSAR